MSNIENALEGKRRPLADLVADAVADAIAAREFKPGDRIVETTISDRMQVSRVPLREGLKILQTQGIITGVDHQSPRVAAFDTLHIKRVLEVRLALEAILLRDAIVCWTNGTSDLAGLRNAIDQMRIAKRLEDVKAAFSADIEFHRQVCLASRNTVAATLWNAIARHVLIIFSLERHEDANINDLVQRHEAFLAFIEAQIEARDPEEVLEKYLREHIFQYMSV